MVDQNDVDDDLDESMMPIYEFEWDSGRTRRTDNLEHEAGRVAVENLATLGRRDEECTVSIVGFEA